MNEFTSKLPPRAKVLPTAREIHTHGIAAEQGRQIFNSKSWQDLNTSAGRMPYSHWEHLKERIDLLLILLNPKCDHSQAPRPLQGLMRLAGTTQQAFKAWQRSHDEWEGSEPLCDADVDRRGIAKFQSDQDEWRRREPREEFFGDTGALRRLAVACMSFGCEPVKESC